VVKAALIQDDSSKRSEPAPRGFITPFEACNNIVASKLLSESELLPQGTIHPGESIKVFIYGVVGVDGSFGNVEVASIPRDPAILKLVEDAVRKRHYSPARCGTKAVASESYIELEISSSLY
jgi:hypothetical protein